MGQNAVIGFPDWTRYATWSGGAWQTDFPLDHVGDREMSRVAKSADLAEGSTQITATLDRERMVGLVAVELPNASPGATWRVQSYDADDELVDDSGELDVYPAVLTDKAVDWGSPNFWSRTYTQAELDGRSFTRPYDMGATRPIKRVEISFDDPDNPDGHLTVAYVAVSARWQLTINMEFGAQHGWQDRAQISRARGGARFVDEPPPLRTFQGEVGLMPHREAWDLWWELQSQLSRRGIFVWHPYPDEPALWLRSTFIAAQREMTAIERAIPRHDAAVLSLEEHR